uniref:Uncharacterized protein n=1 Tax=Setaria viridis TaxID=4556 RepID=A0A4V6DEL1_SETVI|nr:uncharacterized protein LOC117846300 [Setaria viridis]TKW34146.1 hypothetical protein SEVIR_2G285000v2 [Setaria viridis]
MALFGRRKARGMDKSNSAKARRTRSNGLKKRPAVREPVRKFGMIRFIMACPKSPEQDICGDDDDHDSMEHLCPYNHIYGRYFSDTDTDTCRGECAPGERRITSRGSSQVPAVFHTREQPAARLQGDLQDLFSPFGLRNLRLHD